MSGLRGIWLVFVLGSLAAPLIRLAPPRPCSSPLSRMRHPPHAAGARPQHGGGDRPASAVWYRSCVHSA